VVKRSRGELKYVSKVFLRTGLVTVAWFAMAGLALNALGDRVSLQCERNEESLPVCDLSVKHLLAETKINLPDREFQQVTSKAISTNYFPNSTQWQMQIATSRGPLNFDSYGITNSNHWEDFTNRANKFIDAPQLRTFTITSEYSFWFKFLSQAVSGVSILCGLFVIAGLFLTAKYGSDTIAQQQALEQIFGQFGTQSRKDTKYSDLKE
jgi:hypothetical protein